MDNIEVVEAVFEAFRSDDPGRVEGLLADEFVFTSPQDDHIDKATFVRKCLPAAGQITNQRTVHLVEAAGGNVFIMYEYTATTGETHRNTECLTVRDGRIVETQVFFGGRY
ncbi:nuclear transport factor 2 family protein [Labedaea rhizosphaerae]|uniref:Ketosteroid isomerase-like protein n=1 Tax=Labedaea rhizosphaerae TaxID=598644 RepID=A0A4R6S7B3_LABRH|nr:nuclear transport factor 2 family protein [Labedaea rhizosphaerae]TDP95127.1 ketosteroid isomerase-like protein [Labedaea rhizosphaerae]